MILRRPQPWLVLAVVALCAAALLADRASAKTLTGTRGNDVLVGTGGKDTLRGLGGEDTLVGGAGRDRLDGGTGDDAIYARDGVADTVRCGPGWDTVVADGRDAVPADCEQATMFVASSTATTGSTLWVNTDSTNDGDGIVHLFLENPREPLRDCSAQQCAYPNLPTGSTALVTPEAITPGATVSLGGDCAGTTIGPCRLTMDQDRTVLITWNGPF